MLLPKAMAIRCVLTGCPRSAGPVWLWLCQVRWRKKEAFRKPIWDPIAPSKFWNVREKPQYDEEEIEQRRHLDVTYANTTNSIFEYFKTEFYLPTLSAGGLTPEQVQTEKDEQERLLVGNEAENKRVAKLREERLAKELKEMEAQLMVEELKQTEGRKILARQIDEEVKKEVKRAKTYITKETLDAAIEEALANPVHYEYAVDWNGQVIYSGKLHPYALTPSAVPETSSNTEEWEDRDQVSFRYKPTKLY